MAKRVDDAVGGDVEIRRDAAHRSADSDNTPRMHPAELDESGATTLEWSLLLATVAIPSYALIQLALAYLTDLYRAKAMLNALPFP